MNTTAADKVTRCATVNRQLSRRSEICRSVEPGNFFRPARPFIQPKLAVSKPEDAHEREAESTADRIMRMAEPVMPPAAPPSPSPAPSNQLPRAEDKQADEAHA